MEEELKKITPPIRDGTMSLSVSQIESCDPAEDGCYRQWWFKSVMKLPQLKTIATAFGDVLHEVAERFLKADDFGRDEKGKPVDLYPVGWECSTNRWTGKKAPPISEAEKVTLKALIGEAINTGMLNRQQGRQIEKPIKHKIMIHEGVEIILTGFIDLAEPGAIKDHKTTSNRSYMKSTNQLRKTNQLVTYALVTWEQGEWPKDKTIWLEHLYYVCDKATKKLSTERRYVEISYADALRHFNERLKPVMIKMVEYAMSLNLKDGYESIPYPKDVTRSCSKYGGCAYSDICTKTKTVEQYVSHVERIQKSKAPSPVTGESNMASLMDKYKKAQSAGNEQPATAYANTPATTPTQAVAPVTAQVGTPVQEADTDTRIKAPWASDAKCPVCATSPVKGIKGESACTVCAARAKKLGIQVDDYEIVVTEGDIMVVSPDGEVVVEYFGNAPVVSHKEKGESKADVEAKARALAEAQAKAQAEAEAKALAEAQAEAEKAAQVAALKEAYDKAMVKQAEVEAQEAQAKAEADARKAAAILASSTTAVPSPVEDELVLEFVTSRGKGLLLINCAFTNNVISSNKAKIGSPACIITGEELLESAKAMIMGTKEFRAEQQRGQITYWEEINAFKRKELLHIFAPKIADLLSKSTIQCAMIPAGSDLQALVSAISPYFTTINALA